MAPATPEEATPSAPVPTPAPVAKPKEKKMRKVKKEKAPKPPVQPIDKIVTHTRTRTVVEPSYTKVTYGKIGSDGKIILLTDSAGVTVQKAGEEQNLTTETVSSFNGLNVIEVDAGPKEDKLELRVTWA